MQLLTKEPEYNINFYSYHVSPPRQEPRLKSLKNLQSTCDFIHAQILENSAFLESILLSHCHAHCRCCMFKSHYSFLVGFHRFVPPSSSPNEPWHSFPKSLYMVHMSWQKSKILADISIFQLTFINSIIFRTWRQCKPFVGRGRVRFVWESWGAGLSHTALHTAPPLPLPVHSAARGRPGAQEGGRCLVHEKQKCTLWPH